MRDFDEKLFRLKQALDVSEDQQVAAALGMTKAAFSERKRRDAFPDDKVATLASTGALRSVGVDWVLTGQGKTLMHGAAEAAAQYSVSGSWADKQRPRAEPFPTL